MDHGEVFECPVCLDDIPASAALRLPCLHRLCSTCFGCLEVSKCPLDRLPFCKGPDGSLAFFSSQTGASCFTAEEIARVWQILGLTPKSRVVVIDPRRLYRAGVSCLAYTLSMHTTLLSLNLSTYPLGDSGAAAISASLSNVTTLEELILHGCQIGEAGAGALAKLIKASRSLQILILGMNGSGNAIGDAGATSIASALATNPKLLSLSLWKNRIGPSGATCLASRVASRDCLLQKLYIGENPIGREALRCLTDAAAVHGRLRLYGVDYVSDPGEPAVKV
mmetsp:Transcript_13737/g.23600  ORF Transcript_13737/g.23600 Transcript_13737/m.23600 type:complete len:280 (+) Transcript_13737:15-854(+)